jgi:hypothetical protein
VTLAPPTILEALDHPELFKPEWHSATDGHSWRVFLQTLFALPIAPEDLVLFRECTGLQTPPTTPQREAWLVCGRGSGKSYILATIAVYLAILMENVWRPHLKAGERGHISILAVDRRQAENTLTYVHGMFAAVPTLEQYIESETRGEIYLKNQAIISVKTANFRSIRGFTVIAALFDELAFWKDENSANPDIEVLKAIRPCMGRIPWGGFLLGASSPFGKRGLLYDKYHNCWGQPDQPMVWKASTPTMNPRYDKKFLAEAFAEDPVSADAEYNANFRDDVQQFIDRDLLDACTDTDVKGRPPLPAINYVAFADPSGGKADSFTLAIAHAEASTNTVVLDCLYEAKAPFDPSSIVADIKAVLQNYRLTQVTGDRYAAEWVREAFAKEGVTYWRSQHDRSALYLNFLPLLTAGRARLLDHREMATQFIRLERRTGAGKDKVDHPKNSHDDFANSVAGACFLASRQNASFRPAQPIIIGGGGNYYPELQSPVRPSAASNFPPAVRTGKRFDSDFGRDW